MMSESVAKSKAINPSLHLILGFVPALSKNLTTSEYPFEAPEIVVSKMELNCKDVYRNATPFVRLHLADSHPRPTKSIISMLPTAQHPLQCERDRSKVAK
jgi:hypothetical protein